MSCQQKHDWGFSTGLTLRSHPQILLYNSLYDDNKGVLSLPLPLWGPRLKHSKAVNLLTPDVFSDLDSKKKKNFTWTLAFYTATTDVNQSQNLIRAW